MAVHTQNKPKLFIIVTKETKNHTTRRIKYVPPTFIHVENDEKQMEKLFKKLTILINQINMQLKIRKQNLN